MSERISRGAKRRKQIREVNNVPTFIPVDLNPLEHTILEIASRRKEEGAEEFYGYNMLKTIRSSSPEQAHLEHPAIYRALKRMLNWGFFEARKEDPSMLKEHFGARRILYSLTPAGISRLTGDNSNVSVDLARKTFLKFISSPPNPT